MTGVLPKPEAWNDAVAHSLTYPTHILGPYDDEDGNVQICCDGSGDPYEPSNCGFATLSCGRCGSSMHARCYPAPAEY